MHDLYSEQTLQKIQSQLKRRLSFLAATSAVLVAAVVLTLVIDNHKTNRSEVWTTVFALLLAFWLIFYWDLFCRPIRMYAKHLDQALHGRSHEARAEFSHIDEEESVVDGVTYRSLIFLGDPDKHGSRDRLLYWDTQLPLPGLTPGDQVRFRYFDRFLIGYEILKRGR